MADTITTFEVVWKLGSCGNHLLDTEFVSKRKFSRYDHALVWFQKQFVGPCRYYVRETL